MSSTEHPSYQVQEADQCLVESTPTQLTYNDENYSQNVLSDHEDSLNSSRDFSRSLTDAEERSSISTDDDTPKAPPPLPPRAPYENLQMREEEGSNSLLCNSTHQSNPPLQHLAANGPKAEKQDRRKIGGRTLCECEIQFTHENHAKLTGYLKVYNHCTGYPARIEVFDSKKSANDGKRLLYQIPFANVESVVSSEAQSKQVIIIKTEGGDRFIFASSDNNQKLLGYCKLLWKLPGYIIPEIPNCHLVSQHHIEQYSDPRKYDATGSWAVYLINEGVGLRLNFTGLHVVTIQTTNSTFNIYTFEGKHLLAWEHHCIRRTGRVGPVVFLEGGRKCRGGPGVLWMYHPEHLAAKFKNELERFLHGMSATESISVDQSLNSIDQSGQQLLLISDEAENQVIPPSLHVKHKRALDSHRENSLINIPVTQDYRPRTSAMLTSECCEVRMRHCKSSNTKTITPEHYDRNSGAVKQLQTKTVASQDSHSDAPPPRPPKPALLQKHFTEKSTDCSSTKLLESEMQSLACQACIEAMNDKLDVEKSIPALKTYGLLNEKNLKYLTDPKHRKVNKIQYLLRKLPKNTGGWFDKFVDSLNHLPSSTEHRDIARLLLEKLKELKMKYRDSIPLGTPVPVCEEEVVLTGQFQCTDKEATGECTEYISIKFNHPLQDRSSNTLLSEAQLHPSVFALQMK